MRVSQILVAGMTLCFLAEPVIAKSAADLTGLPIANAQLRALLAPWAGAREAQRGATRSTRVAADDATTARTIAGRQGDT